MIDGLEIRIYCPDGNPGNMRCVSIPNWNGGVLYIHRGHWSDAITGGYRDRLNAPGVYILAGDDSQNGGGRKKIYIGQSENLRSRIQQHIDDLTKKFFDHVICIFDYSNHLNSAHFRWAESSLVEKARATGRCEVENRATPNKPSISTADKSTIKRFLDKVYRVFPVVEMVAFTEPKALILTKSKSVQKEMGLGAEKVGHPKTESKEKQQKRAGLPSNFADLTPETLQNNLKVVEHHCLDGKGKTEKSDSTPPEQTEIDDDKIANNRHFRVLGLRDSLLLIQLKKTSEILSFRRNQIISSGNLIAIADLDFWSDLTNGKGLTTQNRERIASSIVRVGERKGEIKGTHLFVGRGAFKDESTSKTIFNTGTKLLAEGADGKLTQEKSLSDSSNFVLPGAEITIVDDPNARDYATEMAATILECRWRERNDGLAFLGWIVAAVIGGALDFRPTLWLSAEHGHSKSFLIDKVLAKLFEEMTVPSGDPTEASIAEMTKSDSLPLILDEFEPEGSRMQVDGWLNILKSVRLASTSGATRTRSGGHGKVNIHRARYTSFISSTRRVNMSHDNIDRIFPVYLSSEGDGDWFSLEDRILAAFHPGKCRAVISLVIRNAAILARQVKTLSRELTTDAGMSTRLAKVCAALSVGARFFTGTNCIVSHPEQHLESGQLELLRELLAATAYQFEGQQFSIADCLTAGYFDEFGSWVGKRAADGTYRKHAQIAAGFGFGMHSANTMLICAGAPRMKKLLAGTKFENTDLAHYMRKLPQIEANGKRLRCAGQSTSAKELPLAVFKHAGFNPTDNDAETVEI